MSLAEIWGTCRCDWRAISRVKRGKSTRGGRAALLSGHAPGDCADAKTLPRPASPVLRFPFFVPVTAPMRTHRESDAGEERSAATGRSRSLPVVDAVPSSGTRRYPRTKLPIKPSNGAIMRALRPEPPNDACVHRLRVAPGFRRRTLDHQVRPASHRGCSGGRIPKSADTKAAVVESWRRAAVTTASCPAARPREESRTCRTASAANATSVTSRRRNVRPRTSGGCRRCPGLRHMGHCPSRTGRPRRDRRPGLGRRVGRSVARKLSISGWAGIGCVAAAPWSTTGYAALVGVRAEVAFGSRFISSR